MKIIKYAICLSFILTAMSCSKEESKTMLKNDLLMKTVAPPIAGETLEFAYAMGTLDGKLKSATAEVSIAGGAGTGFDTKSYHTDSRGNDVGVVVADTATKALLSTATFNVDTNASTLRFNYVIPVQAKGKMISVKFEAESTTGEKVSASSSQYKVSQMDLKRDIHMSSDDVCYFSIETMKAYTEAEVVAQGLTDKIDLVYYYDPLTPEGYFIGHALVSPGSDTKYLNGRTIPASFKKNKTKIEKQVFLRDMQLSGEIPAIFVDDIDLETLDMTDAADFVLGLSSTNSVFVETEDGKYRAYIYLNEARSHKLTFGIKRYQMF